MKNAPRAETAERCTERDDSLDNIATLPTFAIVHFTPVAYGSKRGLFDVTFFDGALVVGGELFVTDRHGPFVEPASIRNRYTGSYERTVGWSEALAAAILGAVLAEAGL